MSDQKKLKEQLRRKHAPRDEEDDLEGDEPNADVVRSEEDIKRGKYTFTRELNKRGIDRKSKEFKQSIDSAMYWLRDNRTFYGYIIDEMSRELSYDIATACVSVDTNGIKMTFNPDFMALLAMRHRVGVIMHECIHVLNLHIPRLKEAIARYGRSVIPLSNIAADLAVNSLLADKRDLPDFGIKPERFRLPKEGVDKESWPQIPARLTYEAYLSILRKLSKDEWKAALAGLPEPDFAPDGGWPRESEHTIDEHDPWLLSDEGLDPDIIAEIIRDRMRRAVSKAAERGHHPGDLAEIVSELLKEKAVNFTAIFQGMIGRFVSTVRRATMMRPSRRYPVPPGRVMARKLMIIWYQDTSGSMSTEEVTVCLSECKHAHATGQAEVFLQQFDHNLQGEMVSVNQVPSVNVGIKGRGGTSLGDVMAHIDKHQPDLAIIGTDGGLEHNLKPKSQVPVAWILTNSGSNPGWGTVVRLPTIAQIKAGLKARNEKIGQEAA